MKQKTKIAYLFVISFFLLAGFASIAALAKNDSDKSDKSEKTSESGKEKDGELINIKNYKKADATKGETNAKIHEEKTDEVIKNLEQENAQTQNVGTESNLQVEIKNKTKKQIEEVVAAQEASQNEVVKAIGEVEGDGNFKKFILGPDYKNLGQLRSELVQNRNQIRKLTQAISTLSQNGEDTSNLELQLQTLTQERERIKNIITTNQEGFSLFGWVSRFLANYEQSPIDEKEEGELEDEVEVVLGGSTTNTQTDAINDTTTNDTSTDNSLIHDTTTDPASSNDASAPADTITAPATDTTLQ